MAILSVVFYHLPKSPDNIIVRALTHFGYLGVDLFFVLSGYLILNQTFWNLKNNKFSVKKFYSRRFLRTLPNYFLVLFIAAYLDDFKNLNIKYLFFLQNFGEFTWHTITWSLCVEEHFYLLVPMLIYFFSKKSVIKKFPFFVLGIVVLGFLVRNYLFFKYRPDLLHFKNPDLGNKTLLETLFYPTYVRLDGLALGGLLAYFNVFDLKQWDTLLKKSKKIGLISLFLLVSYLPLAHKKVSYLNAVPGRLIFAAIFFGFTIWFLANEEKLKQFKNKFITLTSVLSYSMYLTHVFAFDLGLFFSRKLLLSDYSLITYAILLTTSYLIASILYFFWEKLFLGLRE